MREKYDAKVEGGLGGRELGFITPRCPTHDTLNGLWDSSGTLMGNSPPPEPGAVTRTSARMICAGAC